MKLGGSVIRWISERSWLKRLSDHTPRWIGEVGTYLIGGGLGSLLTWYGAVNFSYAPHQLHYIAPTSILAVIVVALGIAARVLGGNENPVTTELRDQVRWLRSVVGPTGAVTQSSIPFASASVGATGPSGSIPVPAPSGASGPQARGVAHDEIHIEDHASAGYPSGPAAHDEIHIEDHAVGTPNRFFPAPAQSDDSTN